MLCLVAEFVLKPGLLDLNTVLAMPRLIHGLTSLFRCYLVSIAACLLVLCLLDEVELIIFM